MMKLFDTDTWQAKRWQYLKTARLCREYLTTDHSATFGGQTYVTPARYRPGAPEVRKAVWFWVSRARIAHAIAMGRQPVIQNFTIADGAKVKSGQIYARPVTNPATLIALGKLER